MGKIIRWFQTLFHRRSCKVAPDFPQLPTIESFEAAGVVFTDKESILAGYQPRKRAPGITGIGGRRQGEEHYLMTAHRECLEELFDWNVVEKSLLKKIAVSITPLHVIHADGYINLVYTFEDLLNLLRLIKKEGLTSPLYTMIPTTLEELILKRKPVAGSEIQGLALLPLDYYSMKHPVIQNEFRHDIQTIVLLLCPHKAMIETGGLYKPLPRNLPKVDGCFTREIAP
jgi:hypothetical protein